MDDYLLLLISFLLLVFFRWIMSLSIMLALSKKAWKNYKLTVNAFDRWFLWSAPKLVKEKYSKFEKRKIDYPTVITVYRTLIIVLHIAFSIFLLTYIFVMFSLIEQLLIHHAFIVYLVCAGICVLVHCVTDLYVNWRFHKTRY